VSGDFQSVPGTVSPAQKPIVVVAGVRGLPESMPVFPSPGAACGVMSNEASTATVRRLALPPRVRAPGAAVGVPLAAFPPVTSAIVATRIATYLGPASFGGYAPQGTRA